MSKFNIKNKNKQFNNFKQSIQLNNKNLIKIRDHKNSQKFSYDCLEFRPSYDYVEKKFPYVPVKDAIIIRADSSLLDKLGYSGMGGFYSKTDRIIVMPNDFNFFNKKDDMSILAKITPDEVAVHELLHFVSDKNGGNYTNLIAEEEFAYGNSVDYLLDKGYTSEQIVENNFLPFLVSYLVDKKKVLKKVLKMAGYDYDLFIKMIKIDQEKIVKKIETKWAEEVKNEAKKIGLKMVKKYDSSQEKSNNVEDYGDGGYDFLDL